MKPLISVITPNFNGYRFIRRAVESVRLQNFSLEHIIVDDCSTDGSWELLLELAAERPWLKPFRLKVNAGPIVARNEAIKLAQGRFLAFLDVDDFWLPEKLSTQIQFMLDKSCALSFSDYRFVTEDGKRIGRRLQGFNSVGWHLHHTTRYLGCLTIVLDRSKIPDFKFPDLKTARRAEDFLAWSNCIKVAGPALRCPHDLARYSVVPKSRSSVTTGSVKSVWRLYTDVEGIHLPVASFYFFIFALGVSWKRFFFRPTFDRNVVDADHGWSLLR
ncbi:glycosyltransferase family 2 protein [bacterium]|nr:glycosyltransferase family 2 protein [bacterium]